MAQYPAATTTVSANRLQTKADTAGQTILTVASVSTTNNTSAGSYAQVTASTSAEYLVTGIVVTCLDFLAVLVQDLPLIIELATGGAGSETVKATFKVNNCFVMNSTNLLGDEARATVPLRVSSGTRLAVRATKTAAVAASAFTACRVDVIVVPYANVEGN